MSVPVSSKSGRASSHLDIPMCSSLFSLIATLCSSLRSSQNHLRLDDFEAGHGLVTLCWELDDSSGIMTISFKGGGEAIEDKDDVRMLLDHLFDM